MEKRPQRGTSQDVPKNFFVKKMLREIVTKLRPKEKQILSPRQKEKQY